MCSALSYYYSNHDGDIQVPDRLNARSAHVNTPCRFWCLKQTRPQPNIILLRVPPTGFR